MKKINFQTILSMKLEVYNYKFDRIGPFWVKSEFVRHISIAKIPLQPTRMETVDVGPASHSVNEFMSISLKISSSSQLKFSNFNLRRRKTKCNRIRLASERAKRIN